MSDLITIIVPIYNCSQYLENCLDTVINQTYKNLQIILIDDGSSDGSAIICDRFAERDSRITVCHKKNEGVSVARNIGIEMAGGKFIYFCDSDDLMSNNCIEKMYNSIIDTNSDFAMCTYVTKDECFEDTEKESGRTSVIKYDEIIEKIITNRCYGGYLWNKLFIRDLVGTLRFDSKLKYCEDKVFCLQYLEKVNSCVLLPNSLYYYRINPNGAINQKFNANRLSYMLSQEFVCDYLLKHCTNEEINRAEHYKLAQLYSSYYFKILVRQIPDKSYWRETIKKGFSQRAHKYGCNPKWSVMTKIRYYILALLFSTNTK